MYSKRDKDADAGEIIEPGTSASKNAKKFSSWFRGCENRYMCLEIYHGVLDS